MDDEWIPAKEAHKFLGSYMHDLVKSGVIRRKRVGLKDFFLKEDVLKHQINPAKKRQRRKKQLERTGSVNTPYNAPQFFDFLRKYE